jgi:hypothetical protein
MTAPAESVTTSPQEVINNLLSEFAGDWQSVSELQSLSDAETKLAVLRQHFPSETIESMSRQEVLSGLERRYWRPLHCDDIESPFVVEALLRAVFYLGEQEAVKLLQSVLEVQFVDGQMGRQTLEAIKMNNRNGEAIATELTQSFVDFIQKNQSAQSEKGEDLERENIQSNRPAQKTSPNNLIIDDELERAVDQMQLPFNERQTLFESLYKVESHLNSSEAILDTDIHDIQRSIGELIDGFKTPNAEKRIFLDRFQQWLQQRLQINQEQTNADEGEEKSEANNLRPVPQFNVDAIAKKSTSDIWTIKDQLGYESYAQSIAKMIVENKAEPPLTISIQAPWGQGKTSLMRMIKHKLEHGL